MPHTVFFAFIGLLLTACLFAWWRGGGPERAIATMFLMAWLLTIATRLPVAQRYLNVGYHTMVIDALLLIGLLAVARRANRAWPVVATSLQLLVVLAHIARAINSHQFRIIYIVMTEGWPLLQLLLLFAGTALHWRRTVIHGAEASWKN